MPGDAQLPFHAQGRRKSSPERGRVLDKTLISVRECVADGDARRLAWGAVTPATAEAWYGLKVNFRKS